MKIFTKVFFLLLLCLISTFVFSQTVYVNSATGNDATGDGSAGNPYKTFHKGYIMVSAGGTLDLTGTFTWTDADEIGDASTSGYTISKNLTIVGSGAESTIIQAASSVYSADRRVFTVSNGYTVSLESLCIRYGYFSSDGAGVYVSGVISIENCDISYNRTTNGSGGGVEVRGKATVTNSTIHNNTAHYMGGGLNRSYYNGTGGAPTASDVLDVINCTIKDNEVTQTVAYIEGAGVFYRRGGGTVTNCTIIDNSCINVLGSSTHGLGVSSESSNVYVKNCIIANNCSNSNTWGGDIGSRETTTKIVNNGGNIIGRIGYYPGGFSVNTTTWTDANNGSSTDGTFLLQDGGSTTGTLNISSSLALNSTLNGTKTLALSVGSIAINNGLTGTNSTISVPANDQRGYSRTGNTDIGSFEYDGVNPLSNTWTGNVNSDWDDAGNWSGGSVPVGTTYAIIPSTYTNPPIVNLALGTPAVCENLNVASGAEFTIAAGMGLTVNDITNNGTITIVSSSSGEGSLLVDGSISGSGTYHVQRYLTGSQWHLVSSPITAGTAGVFHGIWLRAYDESTNTFGEYIVPDATPMPTGQGFSVWAPSAETRTFSGTINQGSIGPLSAQLTGSAGPNTGWNLIGNPYPSAIDWDAASGWTKTNIADAVYVWNGTQYATYVGGIPANGGSRYIAPTQGFFVQATSSGASIGMNNGIRLHNGVNYLKETSEPIDIIRVSIVGNGLSDETVLAVRSGALNIFDPATDAVKLAGSSEAPSLFTTKDDDSELTISCLNSVADIVGKTLNISYAFEGEHVLSWTHSIQSGSIPVLYDNLEEIVIQPDQAYVYTASLSDDSDRFTFIEMTKSELEEVSGLYINMYNDILRVFGAGINDIPVVVIYNIQGQKVLEFNGNEHNVGLLSPGLYLVNVKTNRDEVVEKLIIK